MTASLCIRGHYIIGSQNEMDHGENNTVWMLLVLCECIYLRLLHNWFKTDSKNKKKAFEKGQPN